MLREEPAVENLQLVGLLAGAVFGLFGGGIVTGACLRQKWTTMLSFGLAFFVADAFAFLTVVGTQGMNGHESRVELLRSFALVWGLLFGVLGTLALLTARLGRKVSLHGGVSFFCGGGVAGAIFAELLFRHQIGGSAIAAFWGLTFPVTVPWMLGVAGLIQVLKSRDNGLLKV